MIIPKRFCRLISFFLSFTLLFQTFTPAFVFAQEITSEPTVAEEQVIPTPEPTPEPTSGSNPEVTPTPVVTPEITPEPTAETTSTPEVIPELERSETSLSGTTSEVVQEVAPTPTEAVTPGPTSRSNPEVPLWVELDGDTTTTSENVGEGTDYRFRDTDLIVRFTKVTTPGKLTIRQVKLTPDQIAATGALTDTAYDVTSDMENGSFVYDLTLPLAPNTTNADVKFTSSAENLANSQTVSQTEEIKTNTITIRGLDHFTLFYVVSGENRSEDEGEICDILPCAINPADIAALQDVGDETFDVGSITGWPNLDISEGRYVEFDFGPISPDGIDSATLRLDYATENAEEGSVGVEVRVFDGEDWITVAESDQVSSVDLLSDLTADQLNNLKVRFFMFADPIEDEIVKTKLDRVVLDVSIADNTSPEIIFSDDVSSGPVTNEDVNITATDINLDPSTTKYGFSDDAVCDGTDSYENPFVSGEAFNFSDETQNGKYLCAKAEDIAGNVSYQGSLNPLNIDVTGPTGSITAPVNNSYKKSRPTFDVSASDVSGVASVKFQYRLSGDDDFNDLNTDTAPSPYRAKWGGVSLTTNNVYELRAIVTDNLGNFSLTPIVSFTFDNLLPDIFYNNPLGGETVWYNTGPLFDIDFLYDEGGAPLDYAQYRLDGGSYKNIFTADRTSDYTTNWGISSWSTLTEGLHQLDLRLRDKAGNTNTNNYLENEFGLAVGKDLSTPSSSASSPSYANSSPIPISFTASDGFSGINQVGLWYRFSGGAWIDSDMTESGNSGTFNFLPGDGGGAYEFHTIAADTVGNAESAPEEADAVTTYDATKPSSIITSPANDGTNSIIYANDWDGSIAGTATDNDGSGLARVDLSIQRSSDGKYWNGGDWVGLDEGDAEPRVTADGTESWSYLLTEPGEDTYEIVSHAVDNADNTEDSYKLTMVLDKTIPEVAISLDPADPDSGNGWYKTDPTITLTATDANNDYIEYQWDSQTGTWNVYGSPFKTPGEGDHTLYYRAFDRAGNVSDTGIKRIKYDRTDLEKGPQNVSVSPNPTSGNTAKVKWETASDNVGIDKYEINWSLDGTSTSYTDTVGNDVREHEINKLDQEGKWNVKVTAFDSAGNKKDGSVELTVDRGAPAAPALRLDGTGTGEATLGWNLISDVNDYIIWYGNVPGAYLFGARVGNVNSFTVRGLGGGDYYFVVKSVDSAGNQSGYSNEVNTLTLVGAPGVAPETPAEGFSPEVRGASTEITPVVSPSSEVLGESETEGGLPLWVILAFITSGGLASWAFFRRR